MSDSGDDWEKQLEDEETLEKNLKQDKNAKKFEEEDAYDSEEEKKKKEEAKKLAAANAEPARKKQTNKKDYDQMFEQRLKPSGKANQQKIEEI